MATKPSATGHTRGTMVGSRRVTALKTLFSRVTLSMVCWSLPMVGVGLNRQADHHGLSRGEATGQASRLVGAEGDPPLRTDISSLQPEPVISFTFTPAPISTAFTAAMLSIRPSSPSSFWKTGSPCPGKAGGQHLDQAAAGIPLLLDGHDPPVHLLGRLQVRTIQLGVDPMLLPHPRLVQGLNWRLGHDAIELGENRHLLQETASRG